jgi:multisubunit Na+/H+ antiporter MnhB subunit
MYTSGKARDIIKGAFSTILLCAFGIVVGYLAGEQVPGSPGEFPAATAVVGSGACLLLSAGMSTFLFGWQSVLSAFVICQLLVGIVNLAQ